MTYMTFRRADALSYSRALRHLHHAHGRMPAHQPHTVTLADYDEAVTSEKSRRNGQRYRARKKEAAA